MKKCCDCKKEKELSEFWRRSANPDGLDYRCIPCCIAKQTEWRLKNPGKSAAYTAKSYVKHIDVRRKEAREYAANNREKKTKTFRDWRHNNPEKAKASNRRHYEYQREWLKNHPELTAHHAAKRRASNKQATPPWVESQHLKVIKELYSVAKKLTKIKGESFHVDHIEPLNGVNDKGEHVSSGLHVWWNLRVIPATENLKKSNKLKQ